MCYIVEPISNHLHSIVTTPTYFNDLQCGECWYSSSVGASFIFATCLHVPFIIMNRASLWIMTGQGCAGICGPWYRWEEEDEESATIHSTILASGTSNVY